MKDDIKPQLNTLNLAKWISQNVKCTCNFDSWNLPLNEDTGHTSACRIDKAVRDFLVEVKFND